MTGKSEYFDYWLSRIQRDLAPFADPGTVLHLEPNGRLIHAQWHARGNVREAMFSVGADGDVEVVFGGQPLNYRSFFATPEMADLLSIAKMILQARNQDIFVPTRARRTDQVEPEPGPALDVLQQLLSSDVDAGVTRIVMVTGEAGAGKTRVLRELVRQQAEAYFRGATSRLYLYVNAQGRALARFNEALATELQDLRTTVTYHAISTLVRLGVLIPIIDGFDELLGVGGYDDAFSSLALFVEELDGEGQIVASARSTYYEQEFLARANRVSSLGAQAWTQVPVEVLSWGDQEFSEYVKQSAEIASLNEEEAVNFRARVQAVFTGNNEALRAKPLFVARTVSLLLSGEDIRGEDNLLDELIRAFIERERREKLLKKSGAPLLTSEQIALLMVTLAEEMWNLETRELDSRTIREIAEYVLITEGAGEAEQRVVIERMPTLAFLMPGERNGSVTFEHELFFGFFLSQAFSSAMRMADGALQTMLSRSVLPPEVASTSARLLTERETDELQPLLSRLSSVAGRESPRSTQIRENAGLLVATLLRRVAATQGPLRGLKISNVVFPGGDLGGVDLTDADLESVQLRRVDLSRTRFLGCRSRKCLLLEITVNPEYTRLELAGLDPHSQVFGLRRREGDSVRLIYDPVEVRQTLIETGAVAQQDADADALRIVSREHLDVLDKLMRAYNRSNPVCTSDDNLRNLFRRGEWPDVQNLLLDNHIVSVESRTTGGPPKEFLRRQFLPEQVMAGANRHFDVPEPIREFWDAFETNFPPGKIDG